jgi:queuine tRNA-ribosyltransferase
MKYSKAYLRHLVISGEILGGQISSLHNLAFYLRLVSEARKRIEEGNFKKWKNSIIKRVSEKL